MGTEIDDLYLILRAQVAPLVQGFTEGAAAGEEMAAKVTASVAEINAEVERMSEVVRVSMGVVDESVMAAGVEFNRLQQQTLAATAKMDVAVANAAKSNERLGESMAASSNKFSRFQGPLLAGAAAFAFIGYESVKTAANFESATTRLVTSAGEVQSNLDGVRQGILAMAGQVGDSADELAKAMYIIESGGRHGADGLKVLRAAAEGAKTENADLTTVADAVTSVLQDYNLKADAAALVTSQLVAAVGTGKTTFQQLTGSLHSVLPLAANLKVSLADITGALASMTVHGMTADQAAQNLNDTLRHMAAPTQVQVKELGQLGVSAADLKDMLSSKGLTGTLQYLSQVIMQHMGPSGRVMLNAFNQSRDAARNVDIMIQSMPKNLQALAQQFRSGTISLATWREDLKALPVDQANLMAQFAALTNRSRGFNDILKSGSPAAQTYQDALRRVTGDATGLNTALMLTGDNTTYVNNAVKTVAGATTEAGGHVKGWAEIQGTFNQRMAEAKAGMGALGVSVGEKLLPPLSKLVGWLATGAQWLAKHKDVASILAVAIGALAIAFTVGAVAVWAMNSAMLASPITWIALLIIGLVILIYELVKHWGTVWGWIKRIAVDVWHALVDAWHATWNAIKAVGLWIYHEIILPIARFFDNFLVKPVQAYLRVLIAAWKFAWGFFSVVIDDFVTIWKAEWRLIQTIAELVWNNGLKQLFHLIYLLGIKPIQDAIHLLGLLWSYEWGNIKKAVSLAWDVLKVIWAAFVKVGIDPIRDGIHAFAQAWDLVWNGAKRTVLAVWNFIKPIFDKIGGAISGIIGGIRSIMNAPGAAGQAFAHMLGFDEGGWVPGPPGAPMLAVVHGGEFVLSRDMLANPNRTPAPGIGAGAAQPVIHNHVHVYLDGKEIRNSGIREYQRYKGRNAHTGVT